MSSRLDLQTKLVTLLGTNNVYYQPPESLKMVYPCIRYELNDIDKDAADNLAYNLHKAYLVYVISKTPDPAVCELLINLPYCSFSRAYKQDGLNHYVYKLYY